MTDDELNRFGEGYADCRTRMIKELIELLQSTNLKSDLETLVANLVDEASYEHWSGIKDKHPEKTRAEFEKLLVEFYLSKPRHYFSTTKQNKLQLVRTSQ